MLNLNHFLKKDHDKAIRLYSLYQTHLTETKVSIHQGEFTNAEQYMSQATLMISELRRLHNSKKAEDAIEISLQKLNRNQLNSVMLQKRKDWF